MGWTLRTHHECEGGIEKSVPRITDWHHEACRVMTNGDSEERIFLSHPHTNNGFFFLLTTKYRIYNWKKHEKDFQKILNTLRCDMVTLILQCNDVTEHHAANMWLFVFYLSHVLEWVCEVELSHMGKSNGNPDLVCENLVVSNSGISWPHSLVFRSKNC